MKKTIFVTGATSGFGRAIALRFASKGHRLIINGRREERLTKLEEEIGKLGCDVLSLCFDVRNKQEVFQLIDNLHEDWKNIDVLVNNAGLASGLNHIQDGEIEDWEKMIDTNVKGLLYVSKAIMPLMVERNQGHIINIGSTAGKDVYEKGNVYCATKHAVNALSKAMRIDLLKHRIKVTQISPGAAETEFSEVRFHGDKERAKNAYNGYEPMNAEDIALLTSMATELPENLCINDLVVTSLAQANSYYTDRTQL